ncbi:hypothetical protein PG994_013479 [Apiospora phragmitis]|uniref:Rhodopsin domain-containing protein n=1 Tax=Apiospora phragmitis TaxID=2905665 RepID=A0ABR1TAH1_9PEZI
MSVFLLGGVVTVISILRLVWLVEVTFLPPSDDATYDIRFTYSSVETSLAIISASCPALRCLLIQWFPKLFSSSTYGAGTPGKSRRRYYNDGRYYGQSNAGPSSSHSSNKTKTRRSTITQSFAMQDRRRIKFEVRAHSPSASEEEIMTFDGIMRTTEIRVQGEDVRTSTAASKN